MPVLGTALAFELIQLAFGIGSTDITDLITNTAGGAVGLGLGMVALRVAGARARLWLLAGLVAVLFALGAGFVTWLQVTGVRFRL